MNTQSILEQWQEGDLDNEAALTSLCKMLVSVKDSLEPLEDMQKAIRAQMSEIVSYIGGKASVAGFGELKITEPTITTSYDYHQLDKLVIKLTEAGHADIARSIAECRRETPRAGGLRIDKAKVESE
jgi:hypothetical protein